MREFMMIVESELPTVLYHQAPPAQRDRIAKVGLQHPYEIPQELGVEMSNDETQGIYFTDNAEDIDRRFDMWEVDVRGLDLFPDETTDWPDGHVWSVTYDEVGPDRLRLIHQGTGLLREGMKNDHASTITVYHGGSGPIVGHIQTPFFSTPNLEMARSYAKNKGRGDGRVTAFSLASGARIASEEQAEEAANKAAIDWEGAHISDLFYAAGDYQDPALWEIMAAMGYDGVLINDWGYHDIHNQCPTYVIFNANVLSDPREVEKVESR